MKTIFLVALFVSTFHIYGRNSEKPKLTIISFTSPLLKEGDTVTMTIDLYGSFFADHMLFQTYTTTVKNSTCKFSFLISIPVYFTFTQRQGNSKYDFIDYLIEPEDNVLLKFINADSTQFIGKGANRLRLQFENRKIGSKWLKKAKAMGLGDTSRIISSFETLDSGSVEQIEYLTYNRTSLGDRAYNILVADVLGESILKIEYRLIGYDPSPYFSTWRKALLNYQNKFWENYNKFDPFNEFVKYSYVYGKALIAKYKWDSCVVPERQFSLRDCYKYFKFNLKGSLREKVITTLLYDNSKTEELSLCLQTALNYISNGDFRRLIQKMKKNLSNGSTAYKFNLPDQNGVRRDYSEFYGKVVLLDFWFTGCIGCLRAKPKVDSIMELFAKEQVVLISISVDKERQTWAASVGKNIYTSPSSINLFTEGKAVLHPIISHYIIRGYPTFLVIDKKGRLLGHPINPLIDDGKNFVKLVHEALK